MAQLTLPTLGEDVERRLRHRAALHGRSVEEAAREILRSAMQDEKDLPSGLGSRLVSRFAGIGLTEERPELRGGRVQPALLAG